MCDWDDDVVVGRVEFSALELWSVFEHRLKSALESPPHPRVPARCCACKPMSEDRDRKAFLVCRACFVEAFGNPLAKKKKR